MTALSVSLAIALVGGAPGASAEIRPLPIGALVEDFSLRDLAGDMRALSAIEGKAAIVLAFTAPGCPIAERYARTIQRIAADYGDKGVAVVGINANRQDGVDDLRAFASEQGLEIPILKDHHNIVADQLGATRTTEVFVLDRERKLRYRGAIDDQYAITDRSVGLRKDRPEKTWLTDAVDAILAGKDIETAETTPAGCVIGRELAPERDAKRTYHGDVEAILVKKCLSCHREGQIGPFELETYDDAAGWAGMIREVVENRRMPPWHADPRYGEFSNDRSLTDAERDTIVAWVDAGAARGDAAKAVPRPEFADGWQIGEPDVVYAMDRAFRVPAEGTVKYQYFQIETELPEDRWVQAIEIRPGARDVVHHILLFCIDPKSPRRWQRDQGGVHGYFGAMVPGEIPVLFREGTAKRMPAGATLLLQIHYTTNGIPAEDRSTIGIVFAKDPAQREVKTRSAVNKTFRIPSNTERHEVRAHYTLNAEAELLSFLPHMHLRGNAFSYRAHYPRSVKMSKSPWEGSFHRDVLARLRFDTTSDTLTWLGELDDEVYETLAAIYTSGADRKRLDELRENGKSETLLSVPAYDFGWQNTYRLAEPKRMPKGTLLEAVAHFDNSPRNAALTREMWSRSVRWGDQTWQEMMIGYFDFVEAEN